MDSLSQISHPQQTPAAEDRIADLRLRRIEDLQAEALAKPDAAAAAFGAAKGSLLRIGYRLEEALEEALEKSSHRLENVGDALPVFDVYLKCMRQLDRFEQLDQRAGSAREAKGSGKPR